MRPSNIAGFRSLLEGLRSGETSFEVVASRVRPALENRAARFVRLWRWSGQTAVAQEDLVQEMLLALWRAVDSWDPARADVVRYVDAQLGRACQRRLRKECGYPDPRRSAPATPVSYGHELAHWTGDVDVDAPRVPVSLVGLRVAPAPDAEGAIDAARRAQSLLTELVGLERTVVRLVLEGQSIDAAARVIYADPAARIEYRMDSYGHARRLVGAAVRKVTTDAQRARV